MPKGNTATLLEGEDEGREQGWFPERVHRRGCASAECCKMSRSLSHGQHSQAREQDVHKHGGVRKQAAFRTTNTSVLPPVKSRERGSSLVAGKDLCTGRQVPGHVTSCHERVSFNYR